MKTNKKQEQNRLYKHGIHMSEDIIKNVLGTKPRARHKEQYINN